MRETIEYTVPSDDEKNRDKGKTYKITEWPATKTERWARNVISVMARSGVELPKEAKGKSGIAALALVGITAFLRMDFEEADPLFNEMLTCVQRKMPDAGGAEVVRKLVEDDTEEVTTILMLRSEVFRVLTGFSIAGWLLERSAEVKDLKTAKDTPNTSTSPIPLAP